MADDGFAASRSPAAGCLIDRYELIAQASHEMLAAARHGDWESVARLEDACAALIADLQRAAVSDRLERPEQRRRVALLRAILADDAEIRARAEPWLQQLEHLIRPPAPRAGGNPPRS
jgi:flagellar protein FliT